MNRVALSILAAVIAFAAPTTASAGTATGSTELLAAPVSGSAVDVRATAVSEIPVVPYEYAIQNECSFTGRTNGRPDSIQTDPIVDWRYSEAGGTVPVAIMPVYFTTIPAGSACKVFLLRNNQVVKGSVTQYTVQPS